MFNPYKKQNNALEEFRIKAHMRAFVKDPIEVNTDLLNDAVEKLKKLPFQHKDPTDTVAIELLVDAYRQGHLKYEDLTDEGLRVVKRCKYRRHHPISNNAQMNIFLRYSH